eukprot:COSAG06_NODE_122_length_23062_cov_43.568990_14_plen_233_part_00
MIIKIIIVIVINHPAFVTPRRRCCPRRCCPRHGCCSRLAIGVIFAALFVLHLRKQNETVSGFERSLCVPRACLDQITITFDHLHSKRGRPFLARCVRNGKRRFAHTKKLSKTLFGCAGGGRVQRHTLPDPCDNKSGSVLLCLSTLRSPPTRVSRACLDKMITYISYIYIYICICVYVSIDRTPPPDKKLVRKRHHCFLPYHSLRVMAEQMACLSCRNVQKEGDHLCVLRRLS